MSDEIKALPEVAAKEDLERLRSMRELLGDEDRWCRGANATYVKNGRLYATSPVGDRAEKFCLVGAAYRAIGSYDETAQPDLGRIRRRLIPAGAAMSNSSVENWNDQPSRQHRHVVALLDRAIAQAERDAGEGHS